MPARKFVGTVLDTLGRYRVRTIAFTLSAIACHFYLSADSLRLLMAVRFAGAVFGAGRTAIVAAVQEIIPPSRCVEGTGYFGTSTTLEAALGPPIAIILVRDYGYHWLIIAPLIFTMLGLIAILFLRCPNAPLSNARSSPGAASTPRASSTSPACVSALPCSSPRSPTPRSSPSWPLTPPASASPKPPRPSSARSPPPPSSPA